MPWFRVDDTLSMHAKTHAAGLPAMGLWLLAGSWCAQQGTDGEVPPHMLAAFGGTKAQANRLIEAGLWSEVDGSYWFHDWLDYQPSAEEVRADRAEKHDKKVAAGKLGGIASGVSRRKHSEAKPKQPRSKPKAASQAEGKQNEAPTRPDPSLGSEPPTEVPPRPLVTDAEVTAGSLVAEWIRNVPKRPPNDVIGQVSQQLKALLDEGIDPRDVRSGLAAWVSKGLHPRTLPSVVNEVMNAQPQRPRGKQAEQETALLTMMARAQAIEATDTPPLRLAGGTA